ncbi:D-glucuronyl C5-epimerase family protein [Glutamicibacter creatinolyticus]|uniref:D-glucuronyl C5-epimerase family protein n=1 Tax=Glutamicibacter creatinolyticus TaxID=162496 RepID=UPI0037BF0967
MTKSFQEPWDERYNAPIYKWNDLNSFYIEPDKDCGTNRERHIISQKQQFPGSLDIDALYVRGSGETLIVALHGALVRDKVDLPRYEWLGALSSRNEHQIFIADTALNESSLLTLGWYIGNEDDDLTQKIAKFINRIKNLLGINKVIFLGSSGGGYASLAIATYVENSNVVCFTPQTNVWEFTDGHSKNLLSESFPGSAGIDELMLKDSTRFSLIERYSKKPRLNKFVYIQNLGDKEHLKKHYKPFAESLGVRLNSGRTFDQSGRFISFNHGDGHVAPPKERLDEFLEIAISDLDSPKKSSLTSAGYRGRVREFNFVKGNNTFEKVPSTQNSYYLVSNPKLGYAAPNLTYDENGVPLRVIDGINYDHPVLQAQYLLKQLNTLQRERNDDVEKVVRSTVERWMNYAVSSRGAKFLPYSFPWHGGKQKPPWYSAMAQGQVLSALSRIYELFPEYQFKNFADEIFQSFELLPDDESSLPWIVDIDSNGYLWLEEYPNITQGKFVINGHLFAVWGLYDYWRVFGNVRAYELANAAMETTKKYIFASRNPGWSSHYDLSEFLLIRNYHQTHISQLEMTYNITGNPFFLRVADLFERDFPSYQRGGSMYLAEGEHQIFEFDNIAVPTKAVRSQSISLDKATAFDFSVRTKAEELDGIWLRFTEGPYKDMWIKEGAPTVFPRLCFDRHYYPRPRRVLLPHGNVSHNLFNKWGSPIDRQEIRVESPIAVSVRSRALWNGIQYYEIDSQSDQNLIEPGRWVLATSVQA